VRACVRCVRVQLSAMRAAYEARLSASEEVAAEAGAAHKRELRTLHEDFGRERRANEARLRMLSGGAETGARHSGSGALTAR
jgi:hypothetical protein